jgi:putative DNA primase/helicase
VAREGGRRRFSSRSETEWPRLPTLKLLIHEFPFVPDNASSPDQGSGSRSVVLSLFLTAIVRKSLRAAPLHAFSASDAGSGKTKLVNLASIIATGHEAPAMNPGANEEEFEKRLACHLLAGDAVINVDNCERPISSEKLCSVLTERSTSIRILGNNEHSPKVVNTALITINGNNLAVVGDLTRRAIRCDLNPGVERPELREFSTEDPVVTAKRERPRLVAAALAVLRAHHVNGRPSATVPLGSFEDWSTWIRDALIWLGEPDPCATMEKIRIEDPRRRALASVLRHWHAVIGTDEVTVQQLIGRATDFLPVNGQDVQRREFAFPEFREALIEVAGQAGVISGKRAGNWLRVVKGKIVDGRRIEPGLREGHWRLR